MPDDILDAAQKQINDAATQLGSSSTPPDPAKTPLSPPQLKEEALLKEPVTPATTAPTTDTDEVNSIMESVLGSDKNVDKKPSQPDLTPTVLPPPPPPKRSKVGVILAVLLFLLFTIPLGVYFISQQQQLADLRSRAQIGPYPTTTTTPGPSGTPTGNCNDCGGFNQGQCGVGGSDTINCNPNNTPCEGGMVVCDGGCYPPNYQSCKDYGRAGCYPPETPCTESDPCARVSCPAGQYCNGGACVTGQGGDNIVSFICGQCTADRRCDTGGSVGTQGYSNPCGQVDECQKNADGSINYSTCKAIKLCDPSCSGGTTSPPGGTPGPTSPPGESPTPESSPSPTSPPAGPQCRAIKIYKDGSEVTDLSSLRPGDQITVGVKGDNAVKAHIRLNGADWKVTDQKNSHDEYIYTFTIPSDATKVTLEAEVSKNGSTWE